MSVNRSVARRRIREMLRDMNPSDAIANDFTYNEAIERHAFTISSRVDVVPSAVQSVSLSAGTYEYTMTGVQSLGVTLVQLDSTGNELVFVPWDDFNAYYRQDSSDPRANGTPVEYTLKEKAQSSATENDLLIRFGPTPDATDSADVYLSQLVEQASSPSPSYGRMTDSTIIPFPDDLVNALQASVAAEIAGLATDAALEKRGLGRRAATIFAGQVDPMIRGYNLRMWRMRRAGHMIRSDRERTRVVRY